MSLRIPSDVLQERLLVNKVEKQKKFAGRNETFYNISMENLTLYTSSIIMLKHEAYTNIKNQLGRFIDVEIFKVYFKDNTTGLYVIQRDSIPFGAPSLKTGKEIVIAKKLVGGINNIVLTETTIELPIFYNEALVKSISSELILPEGDENMLPDSDQGAQGAQGDAGGLNPAPSRPMPILTIVFENGFKLKVQSILTAQEMQ